MKVFLVSTEDLASLNIKDRLLETGKFQEKAVSGPLRYWAGNGLVMVQKEGLHLYFEQVDREISEMLEKEGFSDTSIELLVFLSKHRSESGMKSLTVHCPGNYLAADYGGLPGRLPPSAPREMTSALRSLYREKKKDGLKDRTSYEVTHHGPVISTPCFFIEIGSTEERWGVKHLAVPIARALLSDEFLGPKPDDTIAIGVGGGHYAPRFTDIALNGLVSFGHMVPDYILTGTDDVTVPVTLAKEATPGAEYMAYHKTNKNAVLEDEIGEIAGDLGLKML